MSTKERRIGLRLFELESAFASNLDPTSPRLRSYKQSRLLGQAARLAQLIRGLDVIDNLDRLVAIAAGQLKIDPMHFDDVLEILEEADLAERRGQKLYEKVRQVDFGQNYELIGGIWRQRKKDAREEITIEALDELVDSPKFPKEVAAFSSSDKQITRQVVEVGRNSHLIEEVSVGAGQPVLFAPMLWDLAPSSLTKVLSNLGSTSNLMNVVKKITQAPAGQELDYIVLSDEEKAFAAKAVTVGLLPTYPVESVAGKKSFSFTPYSGALINGPAEREILGKARAIVASVRYGERYAGASKIRYPIALLRALLDPTRDYSLARHSEIKQQYGQLVLRGVGEIRKDGSRYIFRLIPSEENKRAVKLAIELITHGQVIEERIRLDGSQALFAPGAIGNEFDGIKIAYERKRASDDELEDIVDILRQT
jgi:hypothetical protein